jgi:hypothetical protein
VKDFIDKYFNQALKSFLDYGQQVEEQIRRTHVLPPVFPSVSAWTKAMLQPLASALDATQKPPEPAPSPEADDLQQVVRDLQQQVAKMKKGRTAPAKRGRKKRP